MISTSEIPQKAKTMDDVHFLMCASKLSCDTGNELERVGLQGTQPPYTVSFYADMETDHQEIIVEDFGRTEKGKWIEMEPTPKQMEIMQKQMSNRVQDIYEELDNEDIRMERYESEYRDELKYGKAGFPITNYL